MGNPITWQNVNAPAMGNPAQFMQLAQNSIDGGFDKLGAVLKQREDTEKANWDQGAVNNEQALRNVLYGAKSPAEMQALQQSGKIGEMLTGFGAQVKNPAALQTAIDGRLGVLQGQETATGTYTDAQVDRTNRPFVDQIGMDTATGNTAAAQAGIDANPTIRNRAALQQALTTETQRRVLQERATTEQGWKATNQAHTEAMQPGALGLQAAQIAASEAATAEKTRGNVVNSLLANTQRRYTESQAKFSQGVTGLANELNIPVNRAGEPVLTGVDGATAQKFKDTIKERLGEPVSSSVFEAEFGQQMVNLGVPVKDQVTAKTLFGQMFNDGSVVSAADAAMLKAKGEKIDAQKKAAKDSNPYIKPAPDDLMKQQGDILGLITSGVKDGEFWTKSTLKKEAQKFMTEGIEYTDASGKKVTQVPTPAMMKLAYQAGLESDTGLFNSTNRNAKEFLISMFKDPDNIELQRKAAEYEADPSGSKAKGDLVNSLRNLPGVQGAPQSLVNNLNAHIASANSRAAIPEAQKKSTEIVAPTPGSTGQPASFATPVPKGSTVGSSQGVALNTSAGTSTPVDVPNIPKDILWGKTQTAVKSTVPGGKVAKVTYVGDGDGLTAQYKDGSNVTCRIDQIDAPEVAHNAWTTKKGKQINASPDQAFGQESKKNLEDMILNKEVTVLVTKAEKNGRTYCEVEFQGKSLGLSQVQAGLAMVYDRYVTTERRAVLKSAEAVAKSTRAGLWKDLNPVQPEKFRRQYN